jgi:hypothetical protein
LVSPWREKICLGEVKDPPALEAAVFHIAERTGGGRAGAKEEREKVDVGGVE